VSTGSSLQFLEQIVLVGQKTARVARARADYYRAGNIMRGRLRHSNLVLVVVMLLGVAFAQKDNANEKNAGTGEQRQTAVNQGATPVLAAKGDGVAVNGDQPTKQRGAALMPPVDPPPAPQFVEDFPGGTDETAETPRPRIPLPILLDSDSPALDRSVRREDIKALPDDYVIGDEDMLTVTIWKERDISGSVVVRPDGRITVPLVGEINVVGMTPLQLEGLLEEKLKPFITVPKVSVAVNQINSRKVYLIGQVVREGTFPINSSMTVLQVLAGAGGLRDFAKKKKIYVLRKRGDQEIRFPFDYSAAIRGRNREENIRVEPGDTIVVP
jgi:polysaccharide biosynthesis/export protein